MRASLTLLTTILVLFNSCGKDDTKSTNNTLTDLDGNIYKIVTIGTQTWMAENLRTTKYNDGTTIPNVTDSIEWASLSIGAYCNYNNTLSDDTITTWGRLYNWHTVNTGKLAPYGWHIPTRNEWEILIEFLGGKEIAGDKLKETGTTYWEGPNSGATNETSFTALPGGERYCEYYYSRFNAFGTNGLWWSSTMSSSTYPYFFGMSNYGHNVFDSYTQGRDGLSIRCVKD